MEMGGNITACPIDQIHGNSSWGPRGRHIPKPVAAGRTETNTGTFGGREQENQTQFSNF